MGGKTVVVETKNGHEAVPLFHQHIYAYVGALLVKAQRKVKKVRQYVRSPAL